jgi:broad specificity phosphatase PhoE
MSVLTLIRHGQASFFAANYDQLSALGEQQSRALGEYWARRGWQFDKVYTGPRARQRRSAEVAVAACRQQGRSCPEPVLFAELDEYDLKGLLRILAPELARQNAQFARLAERYLRGEGEERMRTFQPMFEMLLVHWQSGALNGDDVESWAAFRDRVHRAIRRLQEQASPGERVALFTSGGFISSAAQLALAAPDRTALALMWPLRNASMTEFAITRDRFTLDNFNAIPHLEDPALWTYR